MYKPTVQRQSSVPRLFLYHVYRPASTLAPEARPVNAERVERNAQCADEKEVPERNDSCGADVRDQPELGHEALVGHDADCDVERYFLCQWVRVDKLDAADVGRSVPQVDAHERERAHERRPHRV